MYKYFSSLPFFWEISFYKCSDSPKHNNENISQKVKVETAFSVSCDRSAAAWKNRRRHLFHKEVHKKGFICIFNIANPSICFFLLIQSSAAVVTTLSQLSKVTCTWTGVAQWDSQAFWTYMCLDCRRKAEGERREPPSLQALTIQLWIDETLDLFVKSKKLSLPPVWSEMFLLCESHYGLESGCLRVKEINTINKNRLMQIANHFRIIHTESINGQLNMEKAHLNALKVNSLLF